MQLVFNAVSSCIKALFSQNALQLVRLPLCNLVRCMVGSWELPCSHLHPHKSAGLSMQHKVHPDAAGLRVRIATLWQVNGQL